MKSVLAWHFVATHLRDGRPVPADGEWLIHDGQVRLCHSGLHGSHRLLDALYYAPGPTLCRTEHRGEIIHGGDKLCSAERKILWRIDAESLLLRFAAMCALDVIHLHGSPPKMAATLRKIARGVPVDEADRATARIDARESLATALKGIRSRRQESILAAWDTTRCATRNSDEVSALMIATNTADRAAYALSCTYSDKPCVTVEAEQNRRLIAMVSNARRKLP